MTFREKQNRFGVQITESVLRNNQYYKVIARELHTRALKIHDSPGTKRDAERIGVHVFMFDYLLDQN